METRRDDFELYTFDKQSGWKHISKSLANKKSSPTLKFFITVGVAATLLLVTGFVAYELGQTRSQNVAGSEWQEVERYYRSEIDMRMSLVKNQVDDPQIIADLESMDQAFVDLKRDLKDQVDNEEVIHAMMENYRLKLRILEKILEKINEDENGREEEKINL